MSQPSDLTIRQYARNTIEWRAEFVVSEAHREQVRFSPMSSAEAAHITRGVTLDISSGGMGLKCRQFVPRMTEGSVRVFRPDAATPSSDESSVHEVVFEHRGKVQRVELATHEPSYALGIVFLDPGPDIERRVAALLNDMGPGNNSALGADAGETIDV